MDEYRTDERVVTQAAQSESYDLPEDAMPAADIQGQPAASGSGKRRGGLTREIAETVVPAIIIALLIHVFLAQATRVYGQSMEPNLHTDMRLVVEKISYRLHSPQRGDIVVGAARGRVAD